MMKNKPSFLTWVTDFRPQTEEVIEAESLWEARKIKAGSHGLRANAVSGEAKMTERELLMEISDWLDTLDIPPLSGGNQLDRMQRKIEDVLYPTIPLEK